MTKAAGKKSFAFQGYDEIQYHGVLASRIAAGVDVNRPIGVDADNPNGWSPLELAARHGNVVGCRMLLGAGAKPERRGPAFCRSAITELFYRMRNRDEEQIIAIIDMLVGAGANPNGMREGDGVVMEGNSPIYLAASQNLHEVVTHLVRLGVDLEGKLQVPMRRGSSHTVLEGIRDLLIDGNSPDSSCVDPSMLVTLMRLGADDKCLARRGKTPFQNCVASDFHETFEYYLRERGEDPAQQCQGKTLVELARWEKARSVLRSLATEMAVGAALEPVAECDQLRPKTSKGMAPL
jgi:hypothetical protein